MSDERRRQTCADPEYVPSGMGAATTDDWIARIATRRRAKGDVKRAMITFVKNSVESDAT